MFMAILDPTIVSVALPTLDRQPGPAASRRAVLRAGARSSYCWPAIGGSVRYMLLIRGDESASEYPAAGCGMIGIRGLWPR
jgi:hypothetical protein